MRRSRVSGSESRAEEGQPGASQTLQSTSRGSKFRMETTRLDNLGGQREQSLRAASMPLHSLNIVNMFLGRSARSTDIVIT